MGWAIVVGLVAAFMGYRLGYSKGIRVGASKTQSELVRGATVDLSETDQNSLAEQMGELRKERPSSSIRNLDQFTRKAFELGRLVAQANWHAGAAYQERATEAVMKRYDRP
jgi:hypothetical protein